MGLCFVPLTLAAVAGVRGEESGVASALLNAAQQVGGALGLAVLGTVAATATRHRPAGPAPDPAGALVHGYAVAFLVAGCVLLGAAAVAAAVVRVPAGQRDAAAPAVL